ncbi:DNA-directed RNA polymerase subunit beta, partial [Candidatus Poribacteria bacterium]|nr:DNA-directed RNA polymerase subunit beta [Candidatus Poribacteria bacterium]
MGELPLMTETGTFVINGAERVIVSQLHRSPGVICSEETHSSGKNLFSARIIPYSGAWIEFEYDTSDVINVRLDHRKKMPASLLLRALGWTTNEMILRLFSRVETMEISPWEQAEDTLESSEFENGIGRLITGDIVSERPIEIIARAYNTLTENLIGRLKDTNIKEIYVTSADFPSYLLGRITASPLFDIETGEVIVQSNEEITMEDLESIRIANCMKLYLLNEKGEKDIVSIPTWNVNPVVFEQNRFHKLADHILLQDVIDKKSKERLIPAETLLNQDLIDQIQQHKVDKVTVTAGRVPVHLIGKTIALPLVNKKTGEILADIGHLVSLELLRKIRDIDSEKKISINVLNSEDALYIKAIRNTLKKDNSSTQDEAILEIYKRLQPGDPPTPETARSRIEKMFFDPKRYDLFPVGRYKINQKLKLDVPLQQRILRREDVVETLKYLMKVENGMSDVDDIDHLGNRRVRPVGELLQVQFRNGLVRVERAVRERMTVESIEEITPHDLINSKPLTGAIKDFFGSSQLSQFMQQTNPLDELTHKRRLSALGPGGLHRDRATFEVRDVHHTHYGRLCPIETPEGPSVGLIVSLSTYAHVNEYGFLETPYRKVKNGIVTDQIDYLSADGEDPLIVAQANAPTDNEGKLIGEVLARVGDNFPRVNPEEVDYMDVSPKQVVSVSAAL